LPDNNCFYILYYTIHDVLRAEKILKQHNIPHELIPVPRNLSSDCGMCVKLRDDINKILPLLCKIDIAGCYDAEGMECKEVRSI
jgi:Protein of unknown function (DUF3343)